VVESPSTSENVEVLIDVKYQTRAALARATVCTLRREEGQNGIGIFVCFVLHDILSGIHSLISAMIIRPRSE
jgi:hypothetical protein